MSAARASVPCRKSRNTLVTFDVVDPWDDATMPANPEGIPAGHFPVGRGYLIAPFKRVINAHYLQPLLAIRPRDDSYGPLGEASRSIPDGPTGRRIRHTLPGRIPRRASRRALSVRQQRMMPFTNPRWGKYDYRYFYEASGGGKPDERGNRGSACVTVERVGVARRSLAAQPAGSICERSRQARREGQNARPPARWQEAIVLSMYVFASRLIFRSQMGIRNFTVFDTNGDHVTIARPLEA